MPTVSIIVPAYKAEEWIAQCLAGISAQSYKKIELIVIDDPKGTGPSAARNRGLELATGEYVAFCDADDYLEPEAIGKMVEAIEGVDMVVGSFRKFGAFDMTVQHETAVMARQGVADYAMSNLRDPRRNQMLSGCWAKLYRRSLIGTFREDLTTAEDMAFNFDYLMRCASVRFLSDIVYNVRKHTGSVTTTFDEKNKMGLFGILEGLKHMRNFFDGLYPDEEITVAMDGSKVYHAILSYMRICTHTGLPMNDVFKKLYP